MEGMQGDAMMLLDSVLPEGKNNSFKKNNGNITAEVNITKGTS
jgi:hypothetical protein